MQHPVSRRSSKITKAHARATPTLAESGKNKAACTGQTGPDRGQNIVRVADTPRTDLNNDRASMQHIVASTICVAAVEQQARANCETSQ